MRSLKWFGAAVLALAIAAPQTEATPRAGWAPKARQPQRAGATIDNSGRMDVNNLDMVVTNHGSIALDLITGNSGLIYPKGGTRTAVFAAGLWVGAKVAGNVRVAIGEYSQEFTPGPMAGGTPPWDTAPATYQPDVPEFRNYRIERSGAGYGDYMTYAVPQGAPLDSLGNPLLLGDATIWSVFNDADPGVHSNMSTAPLGLEVQQTVFAFNRAGALGNIIFVKWKFINKGGNTLDSTYVSVWSDPDLGGFTDDLVGCDTTLSLGFCYNATNTDGQYGNRPPAVGYDFLRGPIVWNGASYDTLGMTSFNKYINGTDPATAAQVYNYMSGLQAKGAPIHVNDDPLQPITTYQVSGDPVRGEGWLDSNPADRRLFLSSGPFTMAPGDSQEVVTAIIIGQGTDRLTSITDMKAKDEVAQLVFDLNFDIPPPPPSPIVYAQALDRGIRLIWDTKAVGDVQTSTQLKQEFHFEGFRVWQMASNSADADPTIVATFDEANGVENLYVDEFNPAVGYPERTLKVTGTDSGLEFSLDIDSDRIVGGRLVNNRDYYFAVTAYSYDVKNYQDYFVGGAPVGAVTDILESSRIPIRTIPRSSSAIFEVAAEATNTSSKNVGGDVAIEQVKQNDITGDLYRVTFEEQESERWTLFNVTTAETLLTGQTSIHGALDSPVTDGFITGVTAPRGVADYGEANLDSTFNSMRNGATDATGTWHLERFGVDAEGNYITSPTSRSYILFGATSHDFELRILPDTTETCWTWGSGEASFPATFKIPFEIWDLGWRSLDYTGDDRKMSLMVRQYPDSAYHGNWYWGDVLYVREIPYDSLATASPTTPSTQFVPDGSDQTLGRFVILADDPNVFTTGKGWPDPTRVKIIARRFLEEDTYEFRTAKVGSAPGTVVGNDLSKVLAVPNPYYGRSKYELTQFDRVMKFTNIPASRKVTIRIFNMGGDLVRTIRREATTPDEQALATMEWNLNTERNLPVASGVYIYRLDVEGVGTKTDRIAVFIEQERLDNF